MNALSRREEDALLKSTKARALRECDSVVKGQFCVFLRVYSANGIISRQTLRTVQPAVPFQSSGPAVLNTKNCNVAFFSSEDLVLSH